MKCILIGLIYFYKGVISPILPKNCAYYPTCSTFMLESIKEFGIIKGLCLGTKRLIRCNPKCAGGLDYVPYSIKGDNRWIY
ncbi:MAG: membrane protein insertion efficiency factor YidD [Clostridia bacterium]|nr:membrane protein insertion efficiency factor YidD [Clostridia bacterium]